MTHKLYGFAHSADPVITQYITEQLEAISKQFADVEIEQGNESHEVLLKYSSSPDRFPCLMITKNGICKNYIHAKLSYDDLISWYVTKRG